MQKTTKRDEDRSRLKVLILNQAFYPDVVSTAQHSSELAEALSRRGHQVTALSSTRCYDNPSVRYSRRETWAGVNIRRIWSSGFGKKARWRRATDFATFLANCVWNLLWLERHDVVIALTSPPLISYLAALLTRVRGGRLVFWVMDMNPDQAVAAGWLNPASRSARALQKMLRYSIQRSQKIIALDRFMVERLVAKGADRAKISILPPWSHNSDVFFTHEGRAGFREAHGLTGKFTVMYSGNHSPCHSLQTLMDAAQGLRHHADIAFCFVGGGSEHAKIREFAASQGLTNVFCLPYQPLNQLAGSLSAADLHTVVMGDAFVGMVHPCKIYNVLSIGTPVLYIGPEQSHVGDLRNALQKDAGLFEARHGDITGVMDAVLKARQQARLQLKESMDLAARFSQEALLEAHLTVVESALDPVVTDARGRSLNYAHQSKTITEEL
jgi:hypothetical protein